ncbi:MAG: hypothetical protein H0V29_13880 [Thermoleophilaceae bacterium]|nr:hypothetical protein [Thermoleophilaceae bacterium]
MLFDLQGKRKRVVQAVYLTLAILMGGGLVLFGIGGDVSGGLVDAFTGGNSGNNGDSIVEKRIEENEKKVAANPQDQAALRELIRDNYQLATADANEQTGAIGAEGQKDLQKAADAWVRYVALDDSPDDGSARFAVLVFGPNGLNRGERAADAAEIFADAKPSAQSYLQLSACASLAKQTRKAELAGDKAVDLARGKEQKAQVKAFIEQAKNEATARQFCGQG